MSNNNHGTIFGSFKSSFGNILGTAIGVITVGVALTLYNSRVKREAKKEINSDIGG